MFIIAASPRLKPGEIDARTVDGVSPAKSDSSYHTALSESTSLQDAGTAPELTAATGKSPHLSLAIDSVTQFAIESVTQSSHLVLATDSVTQSLLQTSVTQFSHIVTLAQKRDN